MDIEFSAGLEWFKKDRDGEVKLTLQVPLSDAHKVLNIPELTELKVKVTYEDTGDSFRTEELK